ncbi:unnamed protein product [Protopolystoma xenopodis]|uniref:Uncharacterized protein n=1 Tax=Protopolystoma xenopodis TaxID=117903 RepID=A0A448WP05_9PLAT|nr:unnamed protein product [Protopolystoma xenopodis]
MPKQLSCPGMDHLPTPYHLFTLSPFNNLPVYRGAITPAVCLASPSSRFAYPTRTSYLDLPHGSVDRFLIFLVDRFHWVPVTVYVLLQPLFFKPSAPLTKWPRLQNE